MIAAKDVVSEVAEVSNNDVSEAFEDVKSSVSDVGIVHDDRCLIGLDDKVSLLCEGMKQHSEDMRSRLEDSVKQLKADILKVGQCVKEVKKSLGANEHESQYLLPEIHETLRSGISDVIQENDKNKGALIAYMKKFTDDLKKYVDELFRSVNVKNSDVFVPRLHSIVESLRILNSDIERHFRCTNSRVVDALGSQLFSVSDDISRKNKDFTKNIIEVLSEKMKVLPEKMEVLSEKMKVLPEKMEVLPEKMKVLSEKMEVLSEEMEALSQRVEVLSRKMDSSTDFLKCFAQKNVEALSQKMDSCTDFLECLAQKNFEVLSRKMDSSTDFLKCFQQKNVEVLARKMEGLSEEVENATHFLRYLQYNYRKTDNRILQIHKKRLSWESKVSFTFVLVVAVMFACALLYLISRFHCISKDCINKDDLMSVVCYSPPNASATLSDVNKGCVGCSVDNNPGL